MLLTLPEAAARLGKSERQLRYMIENGTVTAEKRGGRWLVDPNNLPASEGQTQAKERKHAALRDAVETAGSSSWLATERRLQVKAGKGQVVSTAEPCVFLGYRVARAGVSASRKLRRRFAARVKVARDEGPEKLRRTLAAYRGLLTF